MPAAIITAFLATVAFTAYTVYTFRKQLEHATNELYTVLKDDMDTAHFELKNHIQRLGSATRAEVAEAHASIAKLAGTDYADVLKARTDFIELAKGIHTKIDGIEDKTTAAVHAAANASLVAARRTCAFCSRVVHSFEIEAGIVKCTDCKSQGR